MHTKPMKESDGTSGDWKPGTIPCHKCGQETVQYRVWESSCGGYEDVHYRCLNCKNEWWVEGDDG